MPDPKENILSAPATEEKTRKEKTQKGMVFIC